MRWLRRLVGGRPDGGVAVLDPDRQEQLARSVRSSTTDLESLMAGNDGMAVAVRIVAELAREAHADVAAQAAALARRPDLGQLPDPHGPFRPLWKVGGAALRSPLPGPFPCGFHPYVHLPAALGVIGADARTCLRLVDPASLLANLFDLLDLVTAGWEFGGVAPEPAATDLVDRLVTTASQVRAASPDEPPPLPPTIRELMRRNTELSARMRAAFLT
jgi:hypothetical protein